MAHPAPVTMADLNEIPGGAGGIAGVIAATLAGLVAAWRMFKAWAPNDANSAANSSAQIAALDRYEKMLEDERAARHADLAALRKAWADDVATRTNDLIAERKARQEAESRAEVYNQKREEALQELWTLRGQVKALTEQVQSLQATVSQLQGGTGGRTA